MEYLRLKNLFAPNLMNSFSKPQIDPGQPANNPFQNVSFGAESALKSPMIQPTPEYDVGNRMRELYTPETGATDKFNTMIGEYPQYNDPGKLRKIGGSILGSLTDFGTNFGGNRSGIRGTDVFNEVTGKNKFHEDVANWKNKIGPSQQAAGLERSQNINERTMAHQTVSDELKAQAQKSKEKNDTANTKIRQQRADVYQMKAANPNLKFDFSGPFVLIADPASGKVTKTDIETGSLGDADKLALGQTNALERISATGNETRKTDEGRQENRIEFEGIQQPNREKLRSMPSGASGTKGELPTQTRIRQFNAARQLLNTKPELRKFIKLGTPGSQDFEITPPNQSAYFESNRGPTPEQYDEIQKAVYGDGVSINQPNRTGNEQPLTKTQTNQATGEKRTLISNDGGKTWQVQGATAKR